MSPVNNSSNVQENHALFPPYLTRTALWKVFEEDPSLKIFRQCVFCGVNRFSDTVWNDLRNHFSFGSISMICEENKCWKQWMKICKERGEVLEAVNARAYLDQASEARMLKQFYQSGKEVSDDYTDESWERVQQ